MIDDMNDPDNVNAHLDEAPPWEPIAANVVRFPTGAAAGQDLPIIKLVEGELHNIATQAENALIAADAPFFVRGSQMVRPVMDEMPAANNRRTKVARLAEITESMMIDRLSRSADWLKWNAKAKGFVAADPTPKIANVVLSRDGEWRFRRLTGVITTPTMRPDGSLLLEAGYDPSTQLLLIDPPKMPAIPARPTKAHADEALKLLEGLLGEFPFVGEDSRSVALSALITPVVRGAVSVTPMHATSAPVPGSGKSYIIDLASGINSGERAPVLAAGKTEEETEKRLVAALLSGQTLISIDNVNGALGGDQLCQLIERPVVAVRPLGHSTFVKVENRASTYATGNNIHLVGDMTRRVLLCSLDPDVERPELRTFHADPFAEVIADRGRYVAAALTIVRAYVVAGYPDRAKPLASFEDWSNLVRSSLIWLGCVDPCETMNKARADDPTTSALTDLFVTWHECAGSVAMSTGEVKNKAMLQGPHGGFTYTALREALLQVAEDRNGGIHSQKLGIFLKRYEGRIVAGLKLLSEPAVGSSQKLWKVVKP